MASGGPIGRAAVGLVGLAIVVGAIAPREGSEWRTTHPGQIVETHRFDTASPGGLARRSDEVAVLYRIKDGATDAFAGVVVAVQSLARGALTYIEHRAASRSGRRSVGDGRPGVPCIVRARPERP